MTQDDDRDGGVIFLSPIFLSKSFGSGRRPGWVMRGWPSLEFSRIIGYRLSRSRSVPSLKRIRNGSHVDEESTGDFGRQSGI